MDMRAPVVGVPSPAGRRAVSIENESMVHKQNEDRNNGIQVCNESASGRMRPHLSVQVVNIHSEATKLMSPIGKIIDMHLIVSRAHAAQHRNTARSNKLVATSATPTSQKCQLYIAHVKFSVVNA